MKWTSTEWKLWMNMPSFWLHTEVIRIDLGTAYRPEIHIQHFFESVFLLGQNVRPLIKREYILDVATEAEPLDANYSLWFRRVIWSLALKLDNELYVTMHYNQVNRKCHVLLNACFF